MKLFKLSKTFVALAACGLAAGAAFAADMAAGSWEIGPIIRGRNHSVGMPLTPTPTRSGWSFEFPGPRGSVHYVSRPIGSLDGARRIVMRYRVDAAPGVRFVAQETPSVPAAVSLMIQRSGDRWSGKGAGQFNRWYVPNEALRTLRPGSGEIVVSLADPGWISVFGQPSGRNAQAFAAALRETSSIAVVFGSSQARGHGVYATGPARFTLTSLRIE